MSLLKKDSKVKKTYIVKGERDIETYEEGREIDAINKFWKQYPDQQIEKVTPVNTPYVVLKDFCDRISQKL